MARSPLEDSHANRAALARARGALAEHRSAFDAYAAAALRAEDPLESAALARTAYTYAMFNHPGRFACAPLERRLHELGRAHVPGDPGVSPAAAPRRVLHVATVVYETGGHSRVLERWIERDPRTTTVLLLKDDEPVPDSLHAALAAAGGTLAASLPHADLFARARALRALAAEHDLVVLHVSNHEVVVPLAFADPVGRPPTLLFNHSSHLLWTGVGCADAVASFDPYYAEMMSARRGFAAERNVLLPLPVSPRPLPAAAEARARLGLDPQAPVLLTVASPYKLQPVVEPTYRGYAEAILDAVPDAVLLVAGPAPGDPGAPVHERARVLGPVPDLRDALAAADLLLDSWPLSGGTMVIDAAAAGLPVLTLGDPPIPLMGPRVDELDGAIACAADAAAMVAAAVELLGDPAEREALAARASAHVLARNDAGWADAMEDAIVAALRFAGRATPPDEVPDEPPGVAELVTHLLRDSCEQPCSPRDALHWNLAELPPARMPRTGAELDAYLAELLAAAPVPRRAVTAPPLEPDALADVFAAARRLVAAGEIASCAVVVAGDRIDDAIGLIEDELARGGDLDVELLVGEDVDDVATDDDLVLAAA